MKPQYNISFIYPAAKDGEKDLWQKVGALWPTKSGDGYTGTMDLLGQRVRVAVMPPKEWDRESAGQAASNAQTSAMPQVSIYDDEIPFWE